MRIYVALCEDLKPFTKTCYANPRYANSRNARNPCIAGIGNIAGISNIEGIGNIVGLKNIAVIEL